MTNQGSPPGTESPSDGEPVAGTAAVDEHFKPVGTVFLLGLFVVTLILLWASVYVILISRGVTT